jgi:hypothetical protein
MSTIYDFVERQRENYRSQTIEIAEGQGFSQYQTLRTGAGRSEATTRKRFPLALALTAWGAAGPEYTKRNRVGARASEAHSPALPDLVCHTLWAYFSRARTDLSRGRARI